MRLDLDDLAGLRARRAAKGQADIRVAALMVQRHFEDGKCKVYLWENHVCGQQAEFVVGKGILSCGSCFQGLVDKLLPERVEAIAAREAIRAARIARETATSCQVRMKKPGSSQCRDCWRGEFPSGRCPRHLKICGREMVAQCDHCREPKCAMHARLCRSRRWSEHTLRDRTVNLQPVLRDAAKEGGA